MSELPKRKDWTASPGEHIGSKTGAETITALLTDMWNIGSGRSWTSGSSTRWTAPAATRMTRGNGGDRRIKPTHLEPKNRCRRFLPRVAANGRQLSKENL